jgi:hypothetical protein
LFALDDAVAVIAADEFLARRLQLSPPRRRRESERGDAGDANDVNAPRGAACETSLD